MGDATVVISLIQSLLFAFFGPCTLLFGGATGTLMNFTQAALTSGWFELMASWKSINADNVFVALNGFVAWVLATMALAISSTVSSKLKNMMKGMILFFLIAETPMKAISEALFKNVAGCEQLGDPTSDFPQGLPSGGCLPTDQEFRNALYIQKSISLVFLISGAIAGCCVESLVGKWSVAMSGAAMTVQAVTELVLAISTETGDAESGKKITTAIAGTELVLIYALAGTGFLYQMLTNSFVSAYTPGEEQPERVGIRKYLLCKPLVSLLRCLLAFDAYLNKLVQAILNADLFDKAANAAENSANAAEYKIQSSMSNTDVAKEERDEGLGVDEACVGI